MSPCIIHCAHRSQYVSGGSANGKAQFTLGFDLSPFVARIVAATAMPVNGVLSAAATFYLSVDGAAPVLITVPPNAANSNRTQLATQVTAALAAQHPEHLVGIHLTLAVVVPFSSSRSRKNDAAARACAASAKRCSSGKV